MRQFIIYSWIAIFPVHIAFGLYYPHSISHIFRDWLMGINKKTKKLILVGASAICWALRLSRNDMV